MGVGERRTDKSRLKSLPYGKTIIALVAFVILGCVDDQEWSTPAPPSMIVLAQYVAHGYSVAFDTSPPDHCEYLLRTLGIVYLSEEEMLAEYGTIAWVSGETVHTSVSPDDERWPAIIVHEMLHVYGWCVGTGADNEHSDPRMFGATGSSEDIATEECNQWTM